VTVLLLAAALVVAGPLADVEQAFVAFRDADDTERLEPGPRHRRTRDARAETVRQRLDAVDVTTLSPADRRAYDAMRRALVTEDAASDPATQAVYDAYRVAGSAIPFEGGTLNRLTILGRLAEEPSSERRRRLFLALQPVWTSIAGSYPQLVTARRTAWATSGEGTPFARKAREWGMTLGELEAALTGILAAWRDHRAGTAVVEPWDWYFANGAASRRAASRLTLATTIATAVRYYRDLGADPKPLGVRLDLTPRASKDPVAFTDFIRHGRYERGGWRDGRFLVSATYRTGGLGNLYELMHELGHAAHIAAIRTRPAWNDWPDSDVLTEALADMLGVEAYEPAFLRGTVGAEVDPADAARERLAGSMMDVAWALFEIRAHADGAGAPNAIWGEIVETYLRIEPHAELSWWAMRGQLVDAPGYMTNYALGAAMTESLRARLRALRGDAVFETPTPALYRELAGRLYRFGLERTSREVVEEFLGGPLDTSALEGAIAGTATP